MIPGVIGLLILAFLVKDIKGGRSKKKAELGKLDGRLKWSVAVFCFMAVFSFGEPFYLLMSNEQDIPLTYALCILIVVRALQFVLSFYVGKAIDRFTSLQLLTAVYAIGALASGVLLASSLQYFLLAFVLFGVHDIILINAIRVHISKNSSNKGQAFGMFYFLYAISSALGLLLIGWLWETVGSEYAVLFSFIGTVVVLVMHVASSWINSHTD